MEEFTKKKAAMPPEESGNVMPMPNPFNAKALRLPPAYEANAGIRKQLTTVPVRRPHGQEWMRVHPGPAVPREFGVIILKDDNEVYLLDPASFPTTRTK